MAQDLLLEIGVEELPASFVTAAVEALPGLLDRQLAGLRLEHGAVHAAGTPRRLAVWAEAVAEAQPDLDEQVQGPPARVAFDAGGQPTKAATSFAQKIGCPVEELVRVETPKGEYLSGRRRQKGAPALDLLPAALESLCGRVPFRKSMRWGDGETTFGRPVRWLVALLGEQALPLSFAGVHSGRVSRGHRFLAGGPIEIDRPSSYVERLRGAHVLVDIDERRRVMVERLQSAASELGGELIEDDLLVEENCSLVEEPQVIAGSFNEAFLELPERVILDVARGHQRYFGVRDASGRLMPRYLAVVNTALDASTVRRGNDRVMRARLADARFFYDEDRRVPLGERRKALDGVVFHKRLGSVGDKVRRIERLVPILGSKLDLSSSTLETAKQGAALAKCDLVTLMVGELPELQGEMGRAYAQVQGVPAGVADVIAQHYLPRTADDPTAAGDAGALVAIADRLDTLAGCFAIGLVPTGAADPLALRRAAIGLLRTLLDRGWDLDLLDAVHAAHKGFKTAIKEAMVAEDVMDEHDGFASVKLDLDAHATGERLSAFFRDRLRGLLVDQLPQDVVEACLAAGAERPYHVALKARALGAIDSAVRASVGEVFKRAANIAKDAPSGDPLPPADVQSDVHPSEQALFDALVRLEEELATSEERQDYATALGHIAAFAPVLGRFFEDVFVMVDDTRLRENRLRLMRRIHQRCSSLADFNLLAKRSDG